jgi:transposase
LPAKADTEKQRTFFDTVLDPLMPQAKSGDTTLLFIDASHFVMGCDFLGYIYGKARRFIKTYSGRMRYNVIGALNYLTKKVTTVTNDTYITSKEVCDLLTKIAFEYAGNTIHLVLDNARYQKCKIVQELASRLGITIVYIPAYSPNLNLIERLWKFVKSSLRTKYYDDFGIFQEKIDTIIDSTDKDNKAIVNRLIGKKVQLFDALTAINENTFVNSKIKNKCLEVQYGEGEVAA